MEEERLGNGYLGMLHIGEEVYLVRKVVQYEDGRTTFQLLNQHGDVEGSFEPNKLFNPMIKGWEQ